MSALSAKMFSQSLRCTAYRISVSVRVVPLRTFINKSSQIVYRVSKVPLLCWAANSLSYASAQEAVLPQRTAKRTSIATVQIHRLLFNLRLGVRALVLLLKFSPLVLLYPLSLLSKRLTSYWLSALLWVTETSGPTFIKLGQWASTRRDVFSQEFCDRFSKLHVKVQPHSWNHTKQCLKRAFGEGWRQLFVFDCKTPVGSGCVAQVYRAKARVASVEDPAFQQLVEGLVKEDLLEAWEVPGLGGALGQWFWGGKSEEKISETPERSSAELLDSEGTLTEESGLMSVAIKVSSETKMDVVCV